MAVNGTINIIGIVPSKFNILKDKNLAQMSQILDLSQDKLVSKLSGSNNTNLFVPIANLSTDDKDKATKLTAIDGVQYQKSQGRIYPGNEALGSLVGYVAPITAEELAHKVRDIPCKIKLEKWDWSKFMKRG